MIEKQKFLECESYCGLEKVLLIREPMSEVLLRGLGFYSVLPYGAICFDF